MQVCCCAFFPQRCFDCSAGWITQIKLWPFLLLVFSLVLLVSPKSGFCFGVIIPFHLLVELPELCQCCFSPKFFSERWQNRETKWTSQKNKRGDGKGKSTNTPKIPDKRETLDIPSLPSKYFIGQKFYQKTWWQRCTHRLRHSRSIW